MPKRLSNLIEFRLFLLLAITALSWHLLSLLGSFLAVFTDLFIVLFLSWILAFILEPLVVYLTRQGFPRIAAAVVIYLGIASIFVTLIWAVLPTTLTQLAQFTSAISSYLPPNSFLTPQVQNFLATTLSNSVLFASRVASGLTGLFLIFILSFYLLVSKKEISSAIKSLIPNEYEQDYEFLENVINTTFADFLRVQVFLGLALGTVTFTSLSLLRIDFALSTSITSAILAMVPVVGPVLFLIPPVLAALTTSLQKLVIIVIVLVLAAQLVFNLLSPKLLGQALKIHPITVLLSFLVGYRVAGVWGAIFAVPITSALTIIGRDLIKYWKEEADKT